MKSAYKYSEAERKRKEHDPKELTRLFKLHIAEARRIGHLIGVAEKDPYKDPWVEVEATLFKIDMEQASLARLFSEKFN